MISNSHRPSFSPTESGMSMNKSTAVGQKMGQFLNHGASGIGSGTRCRTISAAFSKTLTTLRLLIDGTSTCQFVIYITGPLPNRTNTHRA